jgi:hypothetical protein
MHIKVRCIHAHIIMTNSGIYANIKRKPRPTHSILSKLHQLQGKSNPLLDEIKVALESELNVTLVQHLEDCPDLDAELATCEDPVLRSCLGRSLR